MAKVPRTVHPTIIHSSEFEKFEEIPICFSLECQDGELCTIPKVNETLKELRECLKKELKRLENEIPRFEFKLDNHQDYKECIFRSFDELIEKYQALDDYQKVVICNPLQYVTYYNDQANKNATTGIDDLQSAIFHQFKKLMFRFNLTEFMEHTEELKKHKHEKFLKLYDRSEMDQETIGIKFYKNIIEAAKEWVILVKNKFLNEVAPETRREQYKEGTLP